MQGQHGTEKFRAKHSTSAVYAGGLGFTLVLGGRHCGPVRTMNESLETANHEGWATTHWTSVVQAVKSPDEAKAFAALQVFCEQYRDVIFNFFQRRVGPDLADTYTQEFFAKNIHGKWEQRKGVLFNIERIPGGRFRYYLREALNWFLLDQRKRKQEQFEELAPDMPGVSVTTNEAEILMECDREVAFGLVRRVMNRLQISDVYLQYFCEQISADHAAAKLGLTSGHFRVSVHRLVPAIREAFREEVRPIVTSEEEIDDEIRHLVKIIAQNRNAAD
jgi:DNA-directed RNA polymerase specialized sigma24 family protein